MGDSTTACPVCGSDQTTGCRLCGTAGGYPSLELDGIEKHFFSLKAPSPALRLEERARMCLDCGAVVGRADPELARSKFDAARRSKK